MDRTPSQETESIDSGRGSPSPDATMEIVASTFVLGCQFYIGNTGTQGTALAVIISHVESCTKLKELMVFSHFAPVFGFTLNVILLW
jgi:hypothetical protein